MSLFRKRMRRLIILAAVLAMLAVLLAMNAKTAPAAPGSGTWIRCSVRSYAEYLTAHRGRTGWRNMF